MPALRDVPDPGHVQTAALSSAQVKGQREGGDRAQAPEVSPCSADLLINVLRMYLAKSSRKVDGIIVQVTHVLLSNGSVEIVVIGESVVRLVVDSARGFDLSRFFSVSVNQRF